ncbi:hypothetical protein [Methyloceanibacter superfactus]|nr:hypothetical protein [Methyloceanibacter superfactus]
MIQERLLCLLPYTGRRFWLMTLWLAALGSPGTATLAEEGDTAMEEPPGVEFGTEFYAGRRGYLHGGMHLHAPLNENQEIGLNGHFVREETGGPVFPSLGATFHQDFTSGFGLEAYSFTYIPVDEQHAWAIGLRGSRRFSLGDEATVTPFLGPVYASVQAIDEATERPTDIDHVMLLGGFAIETGKLELTVFGSHSFFSRDPVGLETHVDLQEMTQFEAYENNDGFARNSLATELAYSPTDRITLTGRYALIEYDDGTRNSIAFVPSIALGPRWEAFAGVQFLRGYGPDQDLVTGGLSLSF